MSLDSQQFRQALKAAFPATLPVFTGYLALGLAYGILMKLNGFSAGWTLFISAITYGGSIQYAAIPLLVTGINPLSLLLLSVLINARHVFYGISMLEKYRGLGKLRPWLIFTLTDETFSISSTLEVPDGVNRKYFFGCLNTLNWSYWVLSGFLGNLLGNFITFNTEGIDFVLTALFVVLFIEQVKTRENLKYGVLGLVITASSVVIFGANSMVIPAMLAILTVLLFAGRDTWRSPALKH